MIRPMNNSEKVMVNKFNENLNLEPDLKYNNNKINPNIIKIKL